MLSGRVRLTEQDKAEWAQYARTVRALPGRGQPPSSIARAPEAKEEAADPGGPALLAHRAEVVAPAVAARRPPALSIGTQPAGVDSATWIKFRTGKLATSRTLDLHGRTAARAFAAFRHFLYAAQADQARCVEVITGRGSGEGGGVLRRELPHWLALPEIRPLVLAAAHPHTANPGSVRLLLRRVR